MKPTRIVAAVFAGLAAVAPAAAAQPQVAVGATVLWGWPGAGPWVPYRYDPHWAAALGLWGPCGARACVDSPYLRRAIQRELAHLEHRREVEARSQRGFSPYATPLHGPRSDWPPPTPEAQVQPAFRGSGEIRPEFSGSGQLRQNFVAPPR